MRLHRHRGSRLTDTAALGLALATAACPGPGTGSMPDEDETGTDGSADGAEVDFELVSAQLDATGQLVTLTFTKPVGPVDQVDPADFRISYAVPESLCGDSGCTDITTYRDPNFFATQYWDYSGGMNYDPFDIAEITPGSTSTQIVLHAAASLEPKMCEAIDYYDAYATMNGATYDLGLFVHHSPGTIPLTSADGESLDLIGAPWVEQPQPVWYTDGNYPDLDPMIEIPCSL